MVQPAVADMRIAFFVVAFAVFVALGIGSAHAGHAWNALLFGMLVTISFLNLAVACIERWTR